MASYKNGPTSYSFELINNGLVKVGISRGYDSYKYIGAGAKKITKTESYVGDIAFWDSKLNELGNGGTIDVTSSSYYITAISVGGNYMIFDGKPHATGTITYIKYERSSGGGYSGEMEIVNENDNVEIIQYTVDGVPIVANYKGKTINRQYSTTGEPPIAGVRSGNTLMQSVNTSGHKVVNGSLWKRISTTEIIYNNN